MMLNDKRMLLKRFHLFFPESLYPELSAYHQFLLSCLNLTLLLIQFNVELIFNERVFKTAHCNGLIELKRSNFKRVEDPTQYIHNIHKSGVESNILCVFITLFQTIS